MDWSLIIENSLKGLIGVNAVYFAVAFKPAAAAAAAPVGH